MPNSYKRSEEMHQLQQRIIADDCKRCSKAIYQLKDKVTALQTELDECIAAVRVSSASMASISASSASSSASRSAIVFEPRRSARLAAKRKNMM